MTHVDDALASAPIQSTGKVCISGNLSLIVGWLLLKLKRQKIIKISKKYKKWIEDETEREREARRFGGKPALVGSGGPNT